jgi:hypothetical protein
MPIVLMGEDPAAANSSVKLGLPPPAFILGKRPPLLHPLQMPKLVHVPRSKYTALSYYTQPYDLSTKKARIKRNSAEIVTIVNGMAAIFDNCAHRINTLPGRARQAAVGRRRSVKIKLY